MVDCKEGHFNCNLSCFHGSGPSGDHNAVYDVNDTWYHPRMDRLDSNCGDYYRIAPVSVYADVVYPPFLGALLPGCGVAGTPHSIVISVLSQTNTKIAAEHTTEPKMEKMSPLHSRKKEGRLSKLSTQTGRCKTCIQILIEMFRDNLWNMMYAKKSKYYKASDPKMGMPDNKFPKELWMHVNGIGTNGADAKMNCREIYEMFGRPVDLLHNPTDGMLLDLLECIAGKTGLMHFGVIEPRKLLMEKLAENLKGAKAKGITKIVLIAHSQGTIITGNAISNLGENDKELAELMKELLEVYIFAGCAHHMPDNVKHLEYLSNRGDVVAWLGHLFPKLLAPIWRNTWGKPLFFCDEGVSHIEPTLWGHSLAPHYLQQMKNGKFAKSKLASEYMLLDNAQKKKGE
eukprot:CAMPEP_0172311104 /NCGR_PEP_ID=MMETSP1058-20130122/13717_1 /TAXON_ID=83371 /ORGANISM="Detonula confervacea, Strain CCMP 353" /LENGTH=399 /DNA_ID=CAMNT_0013024179 /DNA_START=234 /DNA_END=1434 /DNA_ORIENTATION=-